MNNIADVARTMAVCVDAMAFMNDVAMVGLARVGAEMKYLFISCLLIFMCISMNVRGNDIPGASIIATSKEAKATCTWEQPTLELDNLTKLKTTFRWNGVCNGQIGFSTQVGLTSKLLSDELASYMLSQEAAKELAAHPHSFEGEMITSSRAVFVGGKWMVRIFSNVPNPPGWEGTPVIWHQEREYFPYLGRDWTLSCSSPEYTPGGDLPPNDIKKAMDFCNKLLNTIIVNAAH